MLTCSSCGAPAADLVRFCSMCGHPLSAASSTVAVAGVRALARRSKIAIVMLWGAVAFHALAAISAVTDPSPVPASPSTPGTSRADVGSGLLVFAVTIGTPVAWLTWQHLAQRNLHAAGLRDLRFTPAWAVGWWLIPFANLFMPFRTTSELVLRSTAASGVVPVWLAAWWGSWVGSQVLVAFGSGLQGAGIADVYVTGSYAIGAGSASAVVAGILAMRVVRAVQAGQDALIAGAQ